MTRGFVTIATGKPLYYQLAKNLLQSYRLYSRRPYPFAIICDQENEITALFDQVILLPEPKQNYFDKFELLIRCPYDETIFIDSDCLAYDDLNSYWDYFRNADDFSAGGYNFPIDSDDGLFWKNSIGEYCNKVHWKPTIHGGLYFIRKGKTCEAIYAEYQNIMRHYNEYRWPDYCVDEPIFGLAMAAHGCRAMETHPENYIYPWLTTELSCDIFSGVCRYTTIEGDRVPHGKMIHWSVRCCKEPLYTFECEKLELMVSHGIKPGERLAKLSLAEKLLYQYRLRYYGMKAKEFSLRALCKAKHLLKLSN